MDIKEFTALQQQAMNVFTKYHEINFDNAEEVLNYLYEVHPYMTNINVKLPKDHLFLILRRHGYGADEHVNGSQIQQMIRSIMIDVEIEEILNWATMKTPIGMFPSNRVH